METLVKVKIKEDEKGKLENYSAADCKHHHSCYHRTEHRIVREMTPPSLLKAVPLAHEPGG